MTSKMMCGLSLGLVLSLSAQNDPFADDSDADPFTNSQRVFRKGGAETVLKEQEKQVAIMIEMIEVDHLTANEMMLKYSKNANNVGGLREALMELVKKGDAKLQETLWGRSPLNEVGKISAVVEKIYPTEYEPPELPSVVGGSAEPGKKKTMSAEPVELKSELYTSATPSAFDTRNVGTTFEFEAAESDEKPEQLGISIYLEVVKFLQHDHFLLEGHEEDARGIANIVMPRFSSATHQFIATVVPGNHSLLGVFKNGGDEDEGKRVIILMHADLIAQE